MLKDLEQIIGYQFKNKKLLKQALTHSSTTSNTDNNYERLEFLGDRVLGVAIASALYSTFPKEPEGSLSPRHTRLVCKETVSEIAKNLQLNQYMLVANPEIRENENILCDVCEAVIGAIFIDAGCIEAINFVNKHWQQWLHKDLTPPKDSKTKLQEIAHTLGYTPPSYEVISRTGSEHEPTFVIAVRIGNLAPQTGTGHNKKIAEQAAAAKMITLLEQK